MKTIKKITSFTYFSDGDFAEISFTYKEVDTSGNIINENARMSTIVLEDDTLKNIDEIKQYLMKKLGD